MIKSNGDRTAKLVIAGTDYCFMNSGSCFVIHRVGFKDFNHVAPLVADCTPTIWINASNSEVEFEVTKGWLDPTFKFQLDVNGIRSTATTTGSNITTANSYRDYSEDKDSKNLAAPIVLGIALFLALVALSAALIRLKTYAATETNFCIPQIQISSSQNCPVQPEDHIYHTLDKVDQQSHHCLAEVVVNDLYTI
ncbi:uncharacterized protein LOC144424632 [Styela clava]